MSHVLIVEDDLAVQEAYKIKLTQQKVPVELIGDGKAALDYINKADSPLPGVVVLDLMLPGVSGFDLLTAIKKAERWSGIPVIVLSNLAQENDMKKVLELGAKEYLVKADTTIDAVFQKIKSYLALAPSVGATP
ncbi:MAG: hypothetical protein RL141_1079 [Candidatus Parcubacteria bacterium]|jgi:DNA-binding response OmpR family regulator